MRGGLAAASGPGTGRDPGPPPRVGAFHLKPPWKLIWEDNNNEGNSENVKMYVRTAVSLLPRGQHCSPRGAPAAWKWALPPRKPGEMLP